MSNQLEQSVLYAAIQGSITPDQIKPHLLTFTKPGKFVYQAVKWLTDQGQSPPFTVNSVGLACVEQLGAVPAETESYLRETQNQVAGKEILAVLQGAADKLRLLDLQQVLVKQMATYTFDTMAFHDILKEAVNSTSDFLTLEEEAKQWEENDDSLKHMDLGPRLRSLQQETGGLTGTWVVGGAPGSGKSTLAWQLSLRAGTERPVLYYDLENTSEVLFRRTVTLLEGDHDAAYEAVRRIRVRRQITQVFRDVEQLGEPCLVVLDSLQKLPGDIALKQASMEQWLARLDQLKQDGHIIIIVSQLNRYEGLYKGTTDIEHTADFGITLISNPDNLLASDVFIKKNRHGLAHGFLCQLRREASWLWCE